MKKLAIILTLVLMTTALLSGCVPAQYKEGVKIDRGFPDDELPIYDDAIVYFSEEDDDEITIEAGSEDDIEDVIEFYQELFEDKEVYALLDEDIEDDEYYAEGIIIEEELQFEIEIIMAKGKVEEKVFECQFEIIVFPQEDEVETIVETKDEPTDSNDVEISNEYPIDIFPQYPGSIITESGAEMESIFILMYTKDNIDKVTEYYDDFLAQAEIISEMTIDTITTWIGTLGGYSFTIVINDDPNEMIEGYNTGIAILAGMENVSGQIDNANDTIDADFIENEIQINQTITQSGVEITLNNVKLLENYEDDYGDVSSGVLLDITIINTNTDKILSVSPSYDILTINTGEIMDSDYWITSDNINGEIMAEVSKNGVVYYPLNITKPSEVNGFEWVIDAPTDADYKSEGENYIFSIDFINPNYQELTDEDRNARIYDELLSIFQEHEDFTQTYTISDAVYQTGPVTLHIPTVALVSEYKDYEDNVADYIVIGAMVEAEEGATDFNFYSSNCTLVTNTKEQLEADYTFYEYLESSLSGGTYTYGMFCFQLVDSTIDQITSFDVYFDAPREKDTWDELGEELTVTITLEK